MTRLIFVIPLVVTTYLWNMIPRWKFQPRGDEKNGLELRAAVGISLTATHGTLSLRNPDGSFEDIGRVEGSDEYISMMKRLSAPSAKHISPPYSTMEDLWDDIPRVFLQNVRKKLGLPASSDAGILAKLLRSLLTLHPLKSTQSVVISYPPVMALYNDDIIQTAIYLNIPLQTGILFQSRELVAAFAGHGLGLCEHPEDRDGCYDELQRLPVKQVFHVEYTAKAMLFHTAPLRGAIDLADSDIRAVALWDMGGEARGEKDYVEKLRDYVLKFVKEGRFSEEWETVVVMTGDEECVGDEEVKDVIRDGLKMAGITAVRILDARPEFVAARGAAELCFRGRVSREAGELR